MITIIKYLYCSFKDLYPTQSACLRLHKLYKAAEGDYLNIDRSSFGEYLDTFTDS